jgi:hypothetical protein
MVPLKVGFDFADRHESLFLHILGILQKLRDCSRQLTGKKPVFQNKRQVPHQAERVLITHERNHLLSPQWRLTAVMFAGLFP